MENKEGKKKTLKGSSLHQISFQNFTFLPLPIENATLLLMISLNLCMAFRNLTSYTSLTSLEDYRSSTSLYLP